MNGWRQAARLARRELRGGLRGFTVFLLCLTLGVAAIAAVGSVSQSVLQALKSDARAILGGDLAVSLVHRPAGERERAFLASRGAVSAIVTMRSMARVLDARGDGIQQSLIELKAVDGAYPLFGAIDTAPAAKLGDALARRDGRWGALVGESLLARLGLAVGDTLAIGDAAFAIRGTILREPDRLSGGGFALGPRVMVALDALPDTGLVRPGSLITYAYRVKLAPGDSFESFLADVKAAFPRADWQVTSFEDAAPRLERFVGRLTLFLTLVGLTALLVGGVGVANAVRAYLDGKMAVIATLKALGAPARLIQRTYLIQIMVIASAGIVAGLALGALAPLAVRGLLGGLLPVLPAFGLFPLPLAIAALFGLLTALTFSILPVARAGQTPAAGLFRTVVTPPAGRAPRGALASCALAALALAGLAVATAQNPIFAAWFLGGSAVAFIGFWGSARLIMWVAGRVRGVRRPALRLAIANLHRPGAPTASIVLSLGLGLTVLVAIALIEGNFSRTVRQELAQKAPGYFFIDIQPQQLDGFVATVESSPEVERLETVPMLRGRIVAVNGVRADEIEVAPHARWVLRGDRGVTWSASAPAGSPVVAGDWWPADYKGGLLVSVGAEVASGLGIGVGDTLTVNVLGRELEARIANLRRIDWDTLGINFVMIFSPGVLDAAPHTDVATVYTRKGAGGGLVGKVSSRFANITGISVRDALDQAAAMIAKIGMAVRLTAAVTLVAGVLVLSGAVAAGHRRRVYESVVLKVLGGTRRDILAANLSEFAILGLVTAILALLLGGLAAWAVLVFVMETTWTLLPATAAATAAGSLAITLALGLFGTWRALGQPSAPVLRNE